MIIYPAIDLIEGKCVRLSQGDYKAKTIYNENPLEVAQSYENAGIRHLHLVDLDGAKAGKVINWQVIESICKNTHLQVDFGGGIKTADEVDKLFTLGVKQINLGSLAVNDSDLVISWLENYGADKIILSADVKEKKIATHGWTKDSGIDIASFINLFLDAGLKYITCTDIKTDGMLQGPNISIYKELKQTFPQLKIIASGGVSKIEDIKALKEIEVHGVIVGKAIYENRIDLQELRSFES